MKDKIMLGIGIIGFTFFVVGLSILGGKGCSTDHSKGNSYCALDVPTYAICTSGFYRGHTFRLRPHECIKLVGHSCNLATISTFSDHNKPENEE